MADPRLCRRCGKCCHKKIFIDGQVVYLPSFCKFYDPQTRLCTVYENRFELNPHCLTVEEGIQLGVFPADCPYVRDLPDYCPPREECTPRREPLGRTTQELERYFAGDLTEAEIPPSGSDSS